MESNISARSFAWHDLITFYRYRHQLVCTDSAQALTRGSPVGPLALLSRLNPSLGSYTAISTSKDGGAPLIGQIQYTAGDRSAHLLFLMPEEALGQPHLMHLLENFAVQAGNWGAFHLLAEVDESSCAMESLRRTGFSVYAWQRIWKFTPGGETVARIGDARISDSGTGDSGGVSGKNGNGKNKAKNGPSMWRPASSVDEVAVRNLYQSLVPPLVQSAEPLSVRRLPGWVYRQEGEILAYVEGIYGPHGIYLQPLIHPAVENVSQVLCNLLCNQPSLLGRPIYLSIRSYQAWLETVVRDLECQVGPRQALMVKHLVLQQRVAVTAARHSVLEKYAAEPTVPMVRNSTANK